METLLWTSSEVLDEIYGIDGKFERTLENWINLIHPEESQEMLDYLNIHVIEEKNPFDKEYRIVNHRSGEERWVHCRGELSFKPDGRVEKMFGTIQDITERKLAEKSIIESEERLRKIFDESPLSIAISAPDFRFLRVNSAFCRMMGYSEDEVLHMSFRELTHPDYISKDEDSLYQLLEGKIPIYKTEKRYIRKDKSIIWGSATINTLLDSEGHVKYMLAMVEDITSRKKSEFELEKSLSLLKATIESTADGLLVVDTSGKIIQYNRKFAEMWKIPRNILKKQDDKLALDFVHDQLKDPGSFVSNVQRLYSSPEMITNDILEFKDGRVFERYSQPQKINDLTVGRVWSFRDITQKKIDESQLVSAKEKAEESDRLKTAFLHNISHEIRTPMNAIVGFTGLLDEPDLDPEKRKQFINIISQSTGQLLSIISDIVDISNIDTNQVKLTLTDRKSVV
jgi:PAS domain S-box-containing protein